MIMFVSIKFIILIIKSMRGNRTRDKVGLIYTTQTIRTINNPSLQKQNKRVGAGSIRGFTPKRNSSAGKIIIRPCTPKKTLSIQIQTMDIIPIMQGRPIQAQSLFQSKIQKIFDQKLRVNNNKVNFISVSQNSGSNNSKDALSTTIKKTNDCKQKIENKQNTIKRQESGQIKSVKFADQPQNGFKQNKPVKNKGILKEQNKMVKKQGEKATREQKISKLSALYQKNLARYETSKSVLGDLLKQNKVK